jgi:MYXO-CTERM domain-containing protein
MRCTLVVLLIAGLCLAPAASAKGPHAILTPGTEAIEPGREWVATVTFVEFASGHVRKARPTLVARNGGERVSAPLRRVRSGQLGDEYRSRLVFPRGGRWRITVLDGTKAGRRFVFNALQVGGPDATPTSEFVAFPEGSRAEREGAGGPFQAPTAPAGSGLASPLPPEVIAIEETADDDDDGTALWIPAAGVALAGLGLIAVRRRRAGSA